MTPHDKAIWNVADSVRGKIPLSDVPTFLRHCKGEGIPIGVPELTYILQLLGRSYCNYYVPEDVALFMAKLCESRSPRSILDPWAGSGLLAIPLQQNLSPERFDAHEPNATNCKVFKLLEGSSSIHIHHDEPLRSIADSPDKYDLVSCCPPLGARSKGPHEVRVGENHRLVEDDYGFLVILESCLHLKDDGLGVFVVPSSFIFSSGREGKARGTLEELGIRTTAVIELPAGTFEPLTSIPMNLVVLQRTSETSLFAAKYSPDPKHQKELLKNYNAQTQGKSASLGRIIPSASFTTFSEIETAERLDEQSRRMGLVPYPFTEIVLELNIPTRSKTFSGFLERPNSVYLPEMASTHATTSQESLPERLKSYFQLVVNPEVADAEFVANLLNTPFGQLWRDSLRTGLTRRRIDKNLLKASKLYLPPRESREVQRKAVDCQQVISKLKIELNELESRLWKRPTDIERVQALIRSVNREDRYQDWIDTLPYPLASILWVCHTQSGSYEEQYKTKSHFFEALAEFLAVLHLSAFRSNEPVWIDVRKRLNASLANQSLSIETATFGTWKAVVEMLAAEARRLLHAEPKMCFELYRVRNREVLEAITSKRVLTVLQESNQIRNDWVGHAGEVSDDDARAVNEKLAQFIGTVRQVFGVVWEGYELLLPGTSRKKSGVYHYSVRKIMGTRVPFPSESVELIESMEDGRLHLKSPDEKRSLELLPLIKVMPSPKAEVNACYFYNRQQKEGIRFLSYHFKPEASVVQEFKDAAAVIEMLKAD